AGFSVSVTIVDAPTHLAVMLACVGAVTFVVVTGNVFVVAPAATVTEPGTVAALGLLLVSVTTAPPAGAVVVSVTVPVLPAPPITAVGFTVTPFKAAAGFTVSIAVLATPL